MSGDGHTSTGDAGGRIRNGDDLRERLAEVERLRALAVATQHRAEDDAARAEAAAEVARAQAASLHHRIEELTAEARRLSSDLDAVSRELDSTSRELAAAKLDRDAATKELQALRSTRTFRWLEPLRRTYAHVRRRGDPAP